MKTTFFFIALAVSSLLTASVNPYDLVVRADVTSNTLVLRTTTVVDEATRVELHDRRGNVVFRKELLTGQWMNSRLNMKQLPTGSYVLRLVDEYGETHQPFELTDEYCYVTPSAATLVQYPRVNLVGHGLLTVNCPNAGEQVFAIRIKDNRGREVISDKIVTTSSARRAYNLNKLPAGSYYVTISGGHVKEHTTEIALR